MPHTIESFVAKLQAEGVEAGRQEAAKLCDQAQAQADKLLADARKQADQIVAQAKAQGETMLARARIELELAARDTVLGLRQALNSALTAVLAEHARQKLSDAAFLGPLLHDLVLQYAQADIDGRRSMVLNVSPEMHRQLAQWAIDQLHAGAAGGQMALDLKGRLREAGFEYNVSGATVEVTVPSVVEMLADMVRPALAEVIDRSIGQPAAPARSSPASQQSLGSA